MLFVKQILFVCNNAVFSPIFQYSNKNNSATIWPQVKTLNPDVWYFKEKTI